MNSAITVQHFMVLASMMFFFGVLGVLLRKNLLLVMMSIELMLNAVNLIFVAASKELTHIDGQVMVFFVMTVAACEAAVGLAMVIAFYRRYGTVQTDFMRILRG